jgi:hypothetical protein
VKKTTSALIFALILVIWLIIWPAQSEAGNPSAAALRRELRIQEVLLEKQFEELRLNRADILEAWVRIDRESADHLRAQEQDETTESLRLRDADLRSAEAELMMHIEEAQRVRRALVTKRALIDETEAELGRQRTEDSLGNDPITGTWNVFHEPGGQEGQFYLQLDGTLVQGTYSLDGGWAGSLRGTLVAGKVRLERIDQQIGFAAILYGQLMESDGKARLQGRWEATQLASGLPSAGSWLAERTDD